MNTAAFPKEVNVRKRRREGVFWFRGFTISAVMVVAFETNLVRFSPSWEEEFVIILKGTTEGTYISKWHLHSSLGKLQNLRGKGVSGGEKSSNLSLV